MSFILPNKKLSGCYMKQDADVKMVDAFSTDGKKSGALSENKFVSGFESGLY